MDRKREHLEAAAVNPAEMPCYGIGPSCPINIDERLAEYGEGFERVQGALDVARFLAEALESTGSDGLNLSSTGREGLRRIMCWIADASSEGGLDLMPMAHDFDSWIHDPCGQSGERD